MTKKAFYITTTLPYVNADPHIGFALEIVQADALARAKRLAGYDVFFSTGTDEHGQKIWEKAQEKGEDVQVYVDHYAKRFDELKVALNLSNDAFIRTTDTHHIEAAQEMWRRCEAVGDIYKKNFEGLYCVGCESFKTSRDVVNERCPLHPDAELQKVNEENYFFKLSQYGDKLREYITGSIIPESRKLEALQFVDQGLEDFSISRRKERMSWGVPVPGDDEHVMYVWFDALTNYISTTGWPQEGGNFKIFWVDGDTLQVAGKDQVRFQSVMWQAMLMSAQIPTTNRIAYHGFVTNDGQKMSKSLGNVINPFDLVDEFGTDAVRYFLLRHMHPFEDSPYTRDRFIESYNAGLANGLGNLVSRVMKMAEEHLGGAVELHETTLPQDFVEALDRFEFNTACEMVWKAIADADEQIQMTQPFKVIKEDIEKGKELITDLVRRLSFVALLLQPIMPATSQTIKDAIKANKKPENLFSRKDA